MARALVDATVVIAFADTDDVDHDRGEAIVRAIDHGELVTGVIVHDVLLVGLERSGELSRVVEDAQVQLGRDVDAESATRSRAASLLIHPGLQQLDEDVLAAGREGYKQHPDEKAEQF